MHLGPFAAKDPVADQQAERAMTRTLVGMIPAQTIVAAMVLAFAHFARASRMRTLVLIRNAHSKAAAATLEGRRNDPKVRYTAHRTESGKRLPEGSLRQSSDPMVR